MTDESVFRLLGPKMVGPSSSHTAGAVRIGRTARLLYGKQPKDVDVYFHGSFADTWRGHGSDKAIIGGLLGFQTFDERIKEADKFAKEAGLQISFKKIKLGKRYHPNSIKIVVNEGKEDSVYVIAESVGGGDIVIREIMGFKTEITGANTAIILRHGDLIGTLSKITGAISAFKLNILSLRSKDIGMIMVRILPSLTEGEEMF